MKITLRKLFLLVVMIFCVCNIFAATEEVTVNNINYILNSNNTATVGTNTSANGDVTIPASITYQNKTYSVTSIKVAAFKDCSSLKSIQIPQTVTSIERSAFEGCSSLTSLTIPKAVTNINGAFTSCSLLTSIIIPDAVTEIGYYTFWGCSSLTTITVPKNVTKIDHTAFQL